MKKCDKCLENTKRMFLILSGFLIHLVFLASVFDIYFKSPIVHDVTRHSSPLAAPAKRLVLMVADGLRAEAFFETHDTEKSNAPYLRSIIEERGVWGVSHTRVPTESRPGHVAIIAGLYEDPSAIAKGWKENPVEFDSVFNESRYTWSWGSPDILPMFAKGASGDHVYIDTYGAELEDFSGQNSTILLDTWVFTRVEAFFNRARSDVDLNRKLQQDKIVLFLHLLGLDTAGHTHKPHSEEYKENIRAVDQGIQKIEKLIEDFYNQDARTAYIFTADHGMTDWGSHGSGDESETQTPLVAWGPGLKYPAPATPRNPHTPDHWRLSHLARYDVCQADIAPLMATLIGVPLPVNSEGRLPREYLNMTEYQLSEAMFTNARQITAQYDKKRELIETGILPSLYYPFPYLTQHQEEKLFAKIRSYIDEEKYQKAMDLSEEVISLSLAGLEYYHNYYQKLLLRCVTLAYLGWMAWLLVSVVTGKSHPDTSLWHGGLIVNAIFLLLIAATAGIIFVQSLPFKFYIYTILPEIIWWMVARDYRILISAAAGTASSMGVAKLCFLITIYTIGVEILVLSFFHRFVLSIGVVGLALWPVLSLLHLVPWKLLGAWLGSCAFLAVFPMLPVIGREPNTHLVILSGWLWLVLAVFCASKCLAYKVECKQVWYTLALQFCLIPLTIWNIASTASSIRDKKGLLPLNQATSWILLVLSLLLPLFSSCWLLPRLLSVSLALAVPFLLLSASHEALFFLALLLNLLCWLALEHYSADSSKKQFQDYTFSSVYEQSRSLTSADFRRAYFFLFYIILSFFGTGNIASINSFDPTWVRCFLTVFSPFVMTILILWKVMLPFLAVTCCFRALNIIVQAPTGKLFWIVLILSDLMGLHFLHLVRNRGSWLDIGSSISHYVIMLSTVLFLVMLYGVARLLTDSSFWRVTPAVPVSSLELGYAKTHRD